MSKLTERLREGVEHDEGGSYTFGADLVMEQAADRIEHLERVLVQAREALSFYADESRYHGPNQALIEHDEWSAKVGLCAYRLDVARDHGVIASTASAAIDEALKEKTNG
jgi:hypothetical protein